MFIYEIIVTQKNKLYKLCESKESSNYKIETTKKYTFALFHVTVNRLMNILEAYRHPVTWSRAREKKKRHIMKKFEKFEFLSNYRSVTSEVRNRLRKVERERERCYPTRSPCGDGNYQPRKMRALLARAGIKAQRAPRDMVGAANPGEKLAPGHTILRSSTSLDGTRKQPRTRLQLPTSRN